MRIGKSKFFFERPDDKGDGRPVNEIDQGDKENECSICCSDLYENMREMSIEDAIGFQKKILSGHEMMNVVRMGNC